MDAYGIPDVATASNTPTSETLGYLTGLNAPRDILVLRVPEPSTWALLSVGVGLRRRTVTG